ncbi:hypothetical protein FI667_g14789, partial [Globisporangium splendens]
MEEALREIQGKYSELQKKNQELLASIESANKDNNEKSELQKEVDRLRMELNQRNVENERRLKQLNDENNQKIAQSASNLQSLTEEIATLKQTIVIVQESEKNQQRAEELANAKREVEDSNKKRLTAKAETQKLAVELETVQKCLNHLSENANTSCAASIRKMTQLQDRVSKALHVLEKRAAASGNGKKSQSASSNQDDIEVEDLREPETASARERATSPTQGVEKVEESIAQVNQRLTLLVEVAEKLCDMAIEQNEVNLKDVVIDKVTQMFTQCFSEKLRGAYAKVDKVADGLLDSNQSNNKKPGVKS